MGKLVVTEFITLDGVIEDPAWSFDFNRGDEGEEYKGDELKAADAQLLGRITYQGFAKVWPTMKDTGWFGEKMNGMPKYVVSTTLTDDEATWNNTVRRGNAADGSEAGRHETRRPRRRLHPHLPADVEDPPRLPGAPRKARARGGAAEDQPVSWFALMKSPIRLSPFFSSSSDCVYANRMYPLPAAPNAVPGSTATPASVSSLSASSRSSKPVPPMFGNA